MADYTLIISKKALEDLRNALAWYSDKSDSAQAGFINEMDLYYKQIIKNPERYGYVRFSKQLRRASFKKFPFFILYQIENEKIRIAGLIHTSRSYQFISNRYL